MVWIIPYVERQLVTDRALPCSLLRVSVSLYNDIDHQPVSVVPRPTANPTTQILHHDPIDMLASYGLAVGDTAGTRSNNLLDLYKGSCFGCGWVGSNERSRCRYRVFVFSAQQTRPFLSRRKQPQALYIKTDEPLEAPASYDTDRYK